MTAKDEFILRRKMYKYLLDKIDAFNKYNLSKKEADDIFYNVLLYREIPDKYNIEVKDIMIITKTVLLGSDIDCLFISNSEYKKMFGGFLDEYKIHVNEN